ncbi:MAG TPA: hypothetical protein PKE55_12005 [Kiritimatiellia bacterium]|nr:hypothetical protein [Kiritimatiellia bacterium]
MEDSAQHHAYPDASTPWFRTWISQRETVLALASGGCARYAFSATAQLCPDRKGAPLVAYESANPHHHMIMSNSGMTLRFTLSYLPDGTEDLILILAGRLILVDPNDHDALDRYLRYFGGSLDNHSRGARRLYRLHSERAHLEQVSGASTPIPLDRLILRNPFTEKEEAALIRLLESEGLPHLKRWANDPPMPPRVAGIDAFGLDLRVGDILVRHQPDRPFKTPADLRSMIG